MNVIRKIVWYFVLVCIAPSAAMGLATAAVVRLAWGSRDGWRGGLWWVELRPDSWPMNKDSRWPWGGWYRSWGGTTFGPMAVMLAPGQWANEQLIHHERHHARQASAHALASVPIALAFAALGHWWLAAAVWLFLSKLAVGSASVDAFARGEVLPGGNVFEAAADAVGRSLSRG